MAKFDWSQMQEERAPQQAQAQGAGKFDWSQLQEEPQHSEPGFFDGSVKSAINSLPMVGGVVGGIIGTPADALTGPLGTAGGAAIGGYLGTAAKNLINKYYDPASAPKTTTEAMTSPVVGGVEQGLMQATGEAAAPLIGRGIQAAAGGAKALGTKVLSNTLGANPNAIQEYLQFSKRINAAPTEEALKQISDEYVGKLAQDVEANKLSVTQAQDALAAHKKEVALKWGDDVAASTANLSDARADLRVAGADQSNQVAQKTYETKQALKDAQNTLSAEHGQFVQSLKDQRAPTDLAPDVVESVNNLKKQVVDASSAAFDTLKNSGASMPKQAILKEIDDHIGNLMIQGKAPVGGQAESALNSLQKLKAQVSQLGDHLSMSDLKQMVQGLDKDINWTGGAGDFVDAASREKMGVRSAIDSYLKDTVPEYRRIMEPLADKTRLLSDVSGQYGNEAKAYSRIAGIAGKSPADQEMLYRLGEATGQDFKSPVQQHLRAKAVLSDPNALEQIRQSHPSYQEVQKLQAELAQRQTPGFAQSQVASAINSSPEALKLKQAQDAADAFDPRARTARLAEAETSSPQAKRLADAQSSLSASQEKLNPFKKLAPGADNQTTVQAKLAQLGKGGNIETEKMFRELGKLTDTDFVQAMKDRHVLAAFQKGATNGSRNTAIGAVTGWMFGGMGGGAIGATAGRVVDQWGPAITKKILDGAIAVSERPSIATIRSLEIPEPIKRNMIIGLENYLTRGSEQAGGQAALRDVAKTDKGADRTPALSGEARWAQSGAQALSQHAGGQIGQDDVKALMATPRGKQLLIQASDLKPGSKAMQNVYKQIQTELKGAK